jgi:hypothetical protein
MLDDTPERKTFRLVFCGGIGVTVGDILGNKCGVPDCRL